MAVDTNVKRQSAAMSRRLPWLRRFYPFPSGSVDQADRQHAGFVYRGILAGAAVEQAVATVCTTGSYVTAFQTTGAYVTAFQTTGQYVTAFQTEGVWPVCE